MMMTNEVYLLVVLLCCAALVSVAYGLHLDSFSVYTVTQATSEDVMFFEEHGYDIWRTSLSENNASSLEFDIMMKQDDARVILAQRHLPYSVKIQDINKALKDEAERVQNERRSSSSAAAPSWYDTYHTYAEFVQRAQTLAQSFPSFVTYVPSIGSSIEGRAIPALRVNTKSKNITCHIYFEGGIHAREWISPATALYLAEQLITTASTDKDVSAILDKCTFDIVPIVNPDGYVFTWGTGSSNRLWRKNRRANQGGSFGVDLNRNWDIHWCETGASRTPSSDTYCGNGPFSEPEVRAVSQYVLNAGYRFDAAIDIHAYGQLILRPPGWTKTPTVDEKELETVSEGMAAAIKQVHGQSYTSQAIWQLYVSSGSSVDWWYYTQGVQIKLAYGPELRDTGRNGFLLPAAQIIPTGEENFAALKYLANYVISKKN